MKILFLDFDGVLHSTDAGKIDYLGSDVRISGEWLFSQLPHLDNLLARCPDVSVVVSSSWQHCYSLGDLREFLGSAGHRVIGTTREYIPEHHLVATRFEECRVVAEALHAKSWVMVDDQVDLVLGRHVPTPAELARVVLCDPVIGLTTEIIDVLVRKLSDSTEATE